MCLTQLEDVGLVSCTWQMCKASPFSPDGNGETLASTSEASHPKEQRTASQQSQWHIQASPPAGFLQPSIGVHCPIVFLGKTGFRKSLSPPMGSIFVSEKPHLCLTVGGNAVCFYYSLRSSIIRKMQGQLSSGMSQISTMEAPHVLKGTNFPLDLK